MGTVTVVRMTSQEAQDERAKLLAQLGLTLDQARAKARNYQFTEDEVVLWQRVEDLNWLLDR